jgi:hypothetical protein
LNYLDQIVSVAERWLPLGETTLDDGTRLIGRFAPDAYLHHFFPGLIGGELEVLEMFLRRPVPKPLARLYQRFNGFRLFTGEFDIFGLRRSHTRTTRDVWQPFDIQDFNIYERPPRTPGDIVFFAGYQDDLTLLGMAPDGPEVYATPEGKWKIKRTWPDLETCLLSEVERLAALFDDQGKLIGKRGKISPIA